MSDNVSMTTNHLYSPKDLLGQGATSHVFRAYHRATGEERALKISKFRGDSHNQRDIQRELDAFLSLRQDNIVAFHGIEEEVETGRHVIVMEYCSGGSLYAMLQEPEYKHGLDDSEFLVLVGDLKEGLQHMFMHGFIHRDIKPGNILRGLRIDGRPIYKLSDFGTCRHRDTDDTGHMSLVGTEEYLHPDVYERAFIDKSARLQFTNAVDTWSLGATLYHAACGEVPFVPHGGSRNNRLAMYELISRKPPGTVRGFQEYNGGPVCWSQDLPGTTRMSMGLRARVSVIVTNLLERQQSRQWTFQLFFNAVINLKESLQLYVLNTKTCNIHTLYIHTSESLGQVHEVIASQTDIPASDQLLYYGHKQLCELVKPGSTVSNLPNTTLDSPLILIVKSGGEACVFDRYAYFDAVPTLSREDTLLTDVKTVASMTTRIYVILESIRMVTTSLGTIQNFITEFRLFLTSLIEVAENKFESIIAIISEKECRFNLIKGDPYVSEESKQSHDVRVAYLSVLDILSHAKALQGETRQKLIDVKKLIQKEIMGDQFTKGIITLTCVNCESAVQHMYQESKKLLKNFKVRCKIRSLNAIQELQMKNDRRKMNSLYQNCTNTWTGCCQTSAAISVNQFGLWYTRCAHAMHLFNCIHDAVERLTVLTSRLDSSLITLTAYSNRDSVGIILHSLQGKSSAVSHYSAMKQIHNASIVAGGSIELIQGNRQWMRRIMDETRQAVRDLDSGVGGVWSNTQQEAELAQTDDRDPDRSKSEYDKTSISTKCENSISTGISNTTRVTAKHLTAVTRANEGKEDCMDSSKCSPNLSKYTSFVSNSALSPYSRIETI